MTDLTSETSRTELEFRAAQEHVLARHGVVAEARFIEVPRVGRAQVLCAGGGPPVVMLDGIGTPAAMWAPLMARLGGFALHAVDLPGYGLTDAPPDLARDYRSTAVQILCEVLDGLGLERPAIVGSSLGSLWSCWLALDRPDRVGALIHVGCPALAVGTSAPLPMRLLSVGGLGRLLMRLDPPSTGQIERLAKLVREHPLPPEIARLLLATERLPVFARTLRRTLHALVRLRGARPRMALTADRLSRIEQPSLVVIGRDDPFGAAEVGRRIVAALPEGTLHVVDGGHAPWLHHADQVAPPLSSFLKVHASVGRAPARRVPRAQGQRNPSASPVNQY